MKPRISLPTELIQQVGSYLQYDHCKQFSYCSKHLFFTLNRNYFLKHPDRERYENNGITKIFSAALRAVEHYLKSINSPTIEGIGRHPDDPYYVVFNKGSNRATWLMEIIKKTGEGIVSESFCLLSISAVLNEHNGKHLKKILTDEIYKEFSGKYFLNIHKVLQTHYAYSADRLELIENTLIEYIHQHISKVYQNPTDYAGPVSAEFPHCILVNQNFEETIFSKSLEEKPESVCLLM